MSTLVLFFVGPVLLLNGLGLLGRLEPKASAPVNAIVGIALIGVTIYLAISANDSDALIGSIGYFLFAIAYLYVAINNFAGFSGEGLGWYCGWASMVSFGLAVVNFVKFDDPRMGAIWVSWTLLFAAFFVTLALHMEWLYPATGVLAVLQAITTTTLPGALMLLDSWAQTSVYVVVTVQVLVASVFAIIAFAGHRRLLPEDREYPVANICSKEDDTRITSNPNRLSEGH